MNIAIIILGIGIILIIGLTMDSVAVDSFFDNVDASTDKITEFFEPVEQTIPLSNVTINESKTGG